ncbi:MULTISPECIES: glycine betaine ABC transporter substrate-binding protein [unclassified Arthrobacter]|uniref:glycine betaine ABC transporter substrate-binding protein n=1 Tax=unclassified Arthrobacter TaxID=235627 RepID=UPI0028830170|nr:MULTISPECIES: glycine betaine ABC transporter substrate-binding protein [unclassified Arthrobacter]
MFKKIGAFAAVALLAAGVSACSGVSTASSGGGTDSKTITMALPAGYDDSVSVTGLWAELLSTRGYKLETKSVDLAAGFSGIARGDLDGYLNAWLPTTHGTMLEKYKDQVTILEKPFFDNDRLVLVAPKFVPENTIADVVANAAKYDSRIVGIEAGSGEMKILPDVLKKYDATDKLNVVAGSTPATLAALKDAIAKNKPVVATLWTPHWAFSSMDIKVLEDNLEGWPKPDGSHVVLAKDFTSEHPDVAKWLSNFKLTEQQFADLMLAVSEASSPTEGAKKWLENPDNKKAADSWFN